MWASRIMEEFELSQEDPEFNSGNVSHKATCTGVLAAGGPSGCRRRQSRR